MQHRNLPFAPNNRNANPTPQSAELAYRRILARNPHDPDTLHQLGLLCFRTNRHTEGLDLVRRSLLADPANAGFYINQGILLGTLGRFDQAAIALSKAVELDPNQAHAHNNLGVTFEKLRQFSQAAKAFERACDLAPQNAAYRVHLGNAYRKSGKLDLAEEAYQRALELEPGNAAALQNLSAIYQEQACHEEGLRFAQQGLDLQPNDAALRSSYLYSIHYPPNLSLQTIFDEHRAWGRQFADPLTPAVLDFANDRSPDRRLRIGYVSPDFRRHSTATFVEPIVRHHDRSRFEIFLYSSVPSPDDATARFRQMANHWRNIAGMPDEEAAKLIRQDQIDILVDVTGQMGGNRLLVFARKPAPVQLTYIGHPDTTGMKAMDYRVTDVILDPSGCGSDAYQTEQLVRLPRIVGCYQLPAEEISVGALPAIANGFVTFGCLNNPGKLTPEAIELWCRILKSLPQSRLILLADAASPHLRQHFAKHGIDLDGGQLELTGRLKRPVYLQTFNRIDIALDCFPYNGHTTSCDGFWMGVPLVSLAANSYVSRMGLSLLSNLGLSAWCATTPEEYVNIAVAMAKDLASLATLRASLREQLAASPITDAQALTRDLEAAFGKMWLDWCSNTTQRRPF